MQIPCKYSSVCLDPANPLSNFSAEAPDSELFIGYDSFWSGPPFLGSRWSSTGCKSQCVSSVSQEDADICSANQQLLCTNNNNGDGNGNNGQDDPKTGKPYELFANDPESCSSLCPDGNPFTYTVPANTLIARTRIQADLVAFQLACRRAKQQKVCLGSLSPTTGQVGTAYSGTITATGAGLTALTNVWLIVDGALPDGLTMPGVGGATITISGTPTKAGTFNFTVELLETNGNFTRKNYTITIADNTCAGPTIRTWSTVSVGPQTLDLSASSVGWISGPIITSTNKMWLIQSNTPSLWFVDSYDLAAASPVPPVGVYATDGALPRANAICYVPGIEKIIFSRQHWNGASYDIWLSFVRTDGTESSHQVGLTTETASTEFVTVDRGGTSSHQAVWRTGKQIYLINVDAETVIASATLPGAEAVSHYTGICYSCVTDSVFCRHNNDLIELDRVTLATKNTYAGAIAGVGVLQYIKSTKEVWAFPASFIAGTNVLIIEPTTGALKGTLSMVDAFSGFIQGSVTGAAAQFYNEALNAFCIPGPMQGFSGNPYTYYLYDVATRTLKTQIDITAYYHIGFVNWGFQQFHPTTGRIYLAGGPFDVPSGNSGVLEIIAS